MQENCACHSGKLFNECCLPIIENKLPAATAESLMRARYTAYTLQNMDFIESTHHASGSEEFNKAEALDWSKSADWQNLEIIKTSKGNETDEEGSVEFKAHYQIDGVDYVHHEKSSFIKENDQWFFLNGEIINQPLRRDAPKVGRNDPCPCGSGKKYKKCCGK